MRYKAFIIPAVGLVVVLAGFLVFQLNDSLVYFRTPTEIMSDQVEDGDRLRLGGQVVPGSVTTTGQEVTFEVTDGTETVIVYHQGAPQQLFQEGIGVVVEGNWSEGAFHSDTMIIRHDEQYRTRDGDPYETPAEGEAAS